MFYDFLRARRPVELLYILYFTAHAFSPLVINYRYCIKHIVPYNDTIHVHMQKINACLLIFTSTKCQLESSCKITSTIPTWVCFETDLVRASIIDEGSTFAFKIQTRLYSDGHGSGLG